MAEKAERLAGHLAASHDKDFLVLLLVVLIAGAGKYWGIDGWWRRRRR
jgi:hypothetical protein